MNKTSAFEHVGPRVEFGSVQISSDDAEAFRRTALKGLKIRELVVDDAETRIKTTAYTSGLLSDAAADYEVDSTAFFSKSILGVEPDFWRSVISFARFNSKHRDTKIYNIYEVEGYEGEVALAIRRVRIIRNLARLTFDENGDPFEDVYSHQRKAYEVPMVSDDVIAVDERIERIMNRSRISGGR